MIEITDNFNGGDLISAWNNMIAGGVYDTESGRLINQVFKGEVQGICEDNMAAQQTLCAFGRAAAQLCGAPRYFEYAEN